MKFKVRNCLIIWLPYLFGIFFIMLRFFLLLLAKLYRTFLCLYNFHFYHFFIQLNPIKEIGQNTYSMESAQASRRLKGATLSCVNVFYLIPLSLSSIIMCDSLRILTQADFSSTSPELERLFTHLIFPPELYRQGDPMICLAFIMSFVFSTCALTDLFLENKYILYLRVDGNQVSISQGGKDLPPGLSQKLARYYRQIMAFLPFIFATIVTVSQQFFLYFFFARYWTGTFHDYLVLFLLVTFFVYGIFTNLLTVFFYYVTVRCLRLKQNYLSEEIVKLTNQLKEKLVGKLAGNISGNLSGKRRARKASQASLPIYRSFQQLQEQILALYDEIAGQNRLWSKYLTLYISVYIPIICIFIYGALFLQKEILGYLFFSFFMVEITLLLTLISFQSSLVVYRNIKLHMHCLRFVGQIQLSLTFNALDLLKFNNLAANLTFIPSIAFTLINHQRINSKMFEMVTSTGEIVDLWLANQIFFI